MTHQLEPLQMLSILRDRKMFTTLAPVLTKEYFPHELEAIYYALSRYWRSAKGGVESEVAPLPSLRILAKKKCSPKAWTLVEALLDQMEIMEVKPPRAVTQRVQDYIIRQGLSNLALSISQGVDSPGKEVNPQEVKRSLEKLCAISESAEDTGTDYLKSSTDYFSELDAKRVPTGIREIDRGIGGGLGAGELGIIVAPPGGGKTALLVNFGAQALLLGLSVLHVTLEIHTAMVAMRYDMRIGGFTTDQLRANSKLALRSRRRVKREGGRLCIYDRSHQRLTPLGIDRIIEQSEGSSLGLCLVDYGDLLGSDRGLEGRRYELGEVYRELRRISSKYNLPLWTASQTNRGAIGEEFDISAMAEDISKAHTADAIICAVQTREQRAAGQMFLYNDKTRWHSEKTGVTVGMDYATMTVKPLRERDAVVEKVLEKEESDG